MTKSFMREAVLVHGDCAQTCVNVPLWTGAWCPSHARHAYYRLFTMGVTSSIDLGLEYAPGRLEGNGRSLVPCEVMV